MRAPSVPAGAVTVGEDVLTVHALEWRRVPDRRPYVWPVCGAGEDGDETWEWLRRVNCPTCLRMTATR
ncbi:hypothetical protein ACSMX9_05945 [Streptomyces sp. LE64]|uniref:hypothetical protein n=1 Tax=Streptomyces sp. LE64 TaxID=3448653 RepID=UPI0040427B2E